MIRFVCRGNALLAVLLAVLPSVLLPGLPAPAQAADETLAQAVAGPWRTARFAERDRYRHPLQTLEFFGLRPDQTVVEIWPAAGWYMEILAPYLHDRGKYYAAIPAADVPGASREDKAAERLVRERMAADPAHFGKVIVSELHPPQRTEICPAGSADLVLTFRNVHNWMYDGYAQAAFDAFYAALKPGGILGVEEHRARPGTSEAQMIKSGYVTEAYVKALAAHAGFHFQAASSVNANPRDTKDYPGGVWTLPPVLREGQKDRTKYLAIGESDRMTLRFVK